MYPPAASMALAALLMLMLGIAATTPTTYENITEFLVMPRIPGALPYPNSNKREIKYLNTDYLGAGYHILKGNPWSISNNGLDFGWRNKLLNLTHTQNKVSSDGKWYYPDGTDLFSINNCQYAATSVSTLGVHSYYDYLNTLVTVSGASVSGSFSVSAGYTSTKAGTTTTQTVYVQTYANCNAYRALLYPFSAYTYTPVVPFVTALSQLPTSYNPTTQQAFEDFFNDWGTHISTEIFMGARAQVYSTFDASSYDEMVSSGVDVSAAASASWGVYSGSLSGSATTLTQAANYFNSKRKYDSLQCLGECPPNTGNAAAWQASSIALPYTLKYSLVPIHTLAASIYPSVATAMQSALVELCLNTPGCTDITNEPADPPHIATPRCRLCTSCGNGFQTERGRKQNYYDYGTWATFGASCDQSTYTSTWNEASLCCAGDTTSIDSGVCRYCQSCGRLWPADGGSREYTGHWGAFVQYGAECAGGYDSSTNSPHLCCMVETQCRICADSCGGNHTVEIGRANHVGDWSSWYMYANGCTGSKASSWAVPVLCCSH